MLEDGSLGPTHLAEWMTMTRCANVVIGFPGQETGLGPQYWRSPHLHLWLHRGEAFFRINRSRLTVGHCQDKLCMNICGVGVVVVAAAFVGWTVLSSQRWRRGRRILPVFLQESQEILDVSTEGAFVPCWCWVSVRCLQMASPSWERLQGCVSFFSISAVRPFHISINVSLH